MDILKSLPNVNVTNRPLFRFTGNFLTFIALSTGNVYIAMIDDNSAFVSLDCEEKAADGVYYFVFAFLNEERS